MASNKLWDFKSVLTSDPLEAASIVFDKALPAIPDSTADEVHADHERLRRIWGSKVLVSGNRKKVEGVVLANLQSIAYEAGPGPTKFRIILDPPNNAVQVEAFVGSGFTPVKVWRSGETYFACGNADFREIGVFIVEFNQQGREDEVPSSEDEFERATQRLKLLAERAQNADPAVITLVEDRLREVFVEIFEVPSDSITHETRLREDLDADDLDMDLITVAADHAFGFETSDDNARLIRTFGDAVNYWTSRLIDGG